MSTTHPSTRPSGLGVTILLLASACRMGQEVEVSQRPFPEAERVQGMSYAHSLLPGKGYGSEASAASLEMLRELGVEWISITPFAFQRKPDDTSLRWIGSGVRGIGETDERLRLVIQQAHRLGMRVMVKPHVWLRPPEWPGSIRHRTEDDWQTWFASYEAFILHYAALAEESGAEAFCIGNELQMTSSHEAQWREIIREVREVYTGPLTYGANFTEVFDVPFWDALDFIGVSAYFQLVEKPSPDLEQIVSGWKPFSERLAGLSERWNRKIVFTELGYPSNVNSVWRPWEESEASIDLRLQADAIEAFFQEIWNQPWFGGVFFWKWESYGGHGAHRTNGYYLEGKPAAEVVRKYFEGEKAAGRAR